MKETITTPTTRPINRPATPYLILVVTLGSLGRNFEVCLVGGLVGDAADLHDRSGVRLNQFTSRRALKRTYVTTCVGLTSATLEREQVR